MEKITNVPNHQPDGHPHNNSVTVNVNPRSNVIPKKYSARELDGSYQLLLVAIPTVVARI